MVFTTLLLGPGLSRAERALARRLVSTGCRATSVEQREMMGRSGWNVIEQVDVTEKYGETARRILGAYESRAERAADVLGTDELDRRLAKRRAYVQAIEEGLLRRELFVTEVA